MAERQRTGRNLWTAIQEFFRVRFDLDEDRANDFETIEYIKKGVEFRGTNLWILIFAILICSIGLNLNSTAIIIGAMLISPLMGPIMGVGMGMGINDFPLILRSLKNLAIAVIISILVSAIYFAISPLHDAQSELLDRTRPTLWDVLIGFFGGLAGIVAGSRKEKSNAIPGVAIATALMPPLCTAGYAISMMNWAYFFGAFYLFIINSVFISIATWLIVRYLNYPKKEFVDEKRGRRARRYISLFIMLMVIPSIFTGISMVRESIFKNRASQFIDNEFIFDDTRVMSKSSTFTRDSNSIELFLFGNELSSDMIDHIESQLPVYGLVNTRVIIHQNENQADPEDYLLEIERVTQQYTTKIIQDIYRKNDQAILDKDRQIEFLENRVVSLTTKQYPVNDIAAEIKAINAGITSVSISEAVQVNLDSIKQDTLCVALIQFDQQPNPSDLTTLENFLKQRTKSKKLRLIPTYR